MKLRNKKTGEIVDINVKTIEYSNNPQAYPKHRVYKSIAELNEEWEDYEEPKPQVVYYIDRDGEIVPYKNVEYPKRVFNSEQNKAIGNYFETREEAEKVVEKLKAWKRLKEAKFRIKEYEYRPIEAYNASEQKYNIISADGIIEFSMFCYEDFSDDLNLLFGGEE